MSENFPKSMRLFFIDNQGAWPKGAQLVGDMVVWPDAGKYPSFVPVAVAEHPNFDGKIVVQAGNRGLVVSFAQGASDADELRAMMSKGKIEQYRIAIDALIHRMVMWIHGGEPQDDVDALSLMAWMAASQKSRIYARVIRHALAVFMNSPERLAEATADVRANGGDAEADAFEMADAILVTMAQAGAAKELQTGDLPVLRRPG